MKALYFDMTLTIEINIEYHPVLTFWIGIIFKIITTKKLNGQEV